MSETQNQKVSYCVSWNSVLKKASEPLTSEEAAERNQRGDAYTVLVHPANEGAWPVPIEIMWENGHAEVKFLDSLGREKASYIFQKETNDFLFLRTQYYWEYENEDPNLFTFNAVMINEIHENMDGHLRHVVIDKENNAKDATEYREVPNQKNWEPIPEFGDWGSISRLDR